MGYSMQYDWIVIQLNKLDTIPEWATLLFIIVAVAGAVWYMVNRDKTEANFDLSSKTIDILQQNNKALEGRIKIVEDETKECNDRSARDREASNNQHKESMALIHQMSGKLEAYEGLTLVSKEVITDLSSSMQQSVANTTDILETLKSSAVTLKYDTADAKSAVGRVKTDLKEAM